uniref:Uncharacterized protein n=1 Tax=Acrobeloides nanus TaxID=290746 RepID=A0A914C8P4_9BILA
MGNQRSTSAHTTSDHYMIKDKHNHSDHGEARHGIRFATPTAHLNRGFVIDDLDQAPPRKSEIEKLENLDGHSGDHNLANYLEEHRKTEESQEIKDEMWRAPI